MSHFSVLVRLPGSVREEDFEDHIAKLMLPYKESGCSDDDSPELAQYLEFTDTEDEHRVDYTLKSAAMVRLADGTEWSAYDNRFKNPNFFADPRYIYPADAVQFEKQHMEAYATFSQYMDEYCGEKPDEKTGRYGYWQNPNKKWDWWTIGGRWTGKLLIGYDPVNDIFNYEKCWICGGSGTRPDGNYSDSDTFARTPTAAGHRVIGEGCNACGGTGWALKFPTKFDNVGNHLRISELNWDAIREETKKKIDKFWEEWQALCDGKEFDHFDGPRDTALDLGLIECKNVEELTGGEWKVLYWDKPGTPEGKKRNRCDVLKLTTKEWVEQNYAEMFSPISSWARLDAENCWQERGKMGWWANADDTPESNKKHANGLTDWIKSGDQQDWLVVVDAHI